MHIKDPVEILYLALMLRWERTAPPNNKQGLLDGEPERNTQVSRTAYILQKVAACNPERTYSLLARYTRRNDGESYISKDASWMTGPYELKDGWYFEGCTSLEQKQSILQHLTKLGLSGTFAACADDFVAGKSVEKYLPTDDEQEEILRKIQAHEQAGDT
jgi:hypothetical protein